jgi:plastocyanin
VNISKGKKFEGGTPSLDQKGCVFIPHVSMIPQGSSIELLNSDDVMHNLHSWSMKNTAFNEGVSAHGNISKTFEFPETVKVTCDVHKWMTSWLIVQANPYYVLTDANGNYKLEGVPAGTYTVQAWQESLGKATQEVTVTAGGEVKADFGLEKKAKKKRKRKKKKH